MKKNDFLCRLPMLVLIWLCCLGKTSTLYGQTTYYWVGGSSGSLSQSYTAGSAPWSASYGGTAITSALTLTNSDTLVFDGGNIGGGTTGNVSVKPTLNAFTLTSTAVATGTSGSQTAFANATFASTAGVAVGQYVSAGNSLLGGTFVSNLTATTVTFSGYEAGLTTPATTFTFTSITVGGIKVTGNANVTIATPTNSGGTVVTTLLDLGTANSSGSNVSGGSLNDGGNELMVSGNISGVSSGVHKGLGRIRMVRNAAPNGQIQGGVTLGNLYVDGVQRVDAVSNITITNDLTLRGINTTFFGGGFVNITVGGNVYSGIVGASNPANKGTKSVVGNDPGPGQLTLTSTSTISGAITAAVTTAGTGYTSTSGNYAFTLPAPTGGGIGATVLLTVTGGAIATTTASVILLDPGTGYPAGTTVTATVPGGTAVVTLTTAAVSNKYLAIGQGNLEVWGSLVLADAANGNIYIGAPLNNNRALYISKNLTFKSGVDTTGKLILTAAAAGQGSPNALGLGNNVNGTQQNFTIAMAATNAIGVQYANSGKILFGSNAQSGVSSGTVYFDQSTPGVTNNIQFIQDYRGNFTLGNNLVIGSTFNLGGGTGTVALGTIQYGTLKVGTGAGLSLPATLNFGSPGTTGGYSIDASDSNATVTLNGTTIPVANAQTNVAGLFYPSVVGNLINTKGTATINQSLSVINTLTVPDTTTMKLGTGTIFTVSGSVAGKGIVDGSLGSVIMNGTSAQTINLTSAGNLTINNAAGVTASPAVSGLLTITSGDVSDYSNISSTSSVLYNGATAQTANAGLGSLNNLTINNAAGVTLTSSSTVNGALTLTSGKLFITDKTLKLGSASSISQASAANNYIVIGGTASVKRTVAAGVVTLFPVGTSTTYNPVTLTPTAATDLYVSVAAGNTPVLTTIGGTLDVTKTLNRTWNITPTVPSATDITIGYDGVADANTGFVNTGVGVALLHNAGSWEYAQHVLPGSGVGVSKAATFTGITSFSAFGIANPGAGAVYVNGTLAKANDEYRSVASGNWDDASTWEVLNATTLNWESTVTIPGETNTATIRAGHTVTLNSQAGIGTLTIETGATLKSSANAYTAASIVFTVGKANSVINNNGTFGAAIGSATTAGGDGISINIAPACTSFSLTGTGTSGIGNLYPLAGTNNLVAVIDQDIQFRASSASTKKTLLSMIDPSDVTATGSRTLIVNAGKTVSFIDANSCLHSTLFSTTTGSFAAQQGDITYDIQGTLDLAGGNIYLSSSSNVASATQKVKLNIGTAGKVIVAGDYNVNKVQATQAVYTYIEDGGLLDASAAPLTKTNEFGLARNARTTTTLDKINTNATITLSAGSGGYYTVAPVVTITGLSGGSGAVATAVLTGNTVTSIVFSGSNGAYTGTPIISIAQSNVGGLAWVVMGGINASYKRLCGSSADFYNVAVPPSAGNYASINGNPIELYTELSGQTDVYTIGVAKGNTPSPATAFTDVDPAYALNRTWKIMPSLGANAYGTYLYFGFTGGTEDANASYSPTLPAVQKVADTYETYASTTIAIGTTDLFAYKSFTGKWASYTVWNTSNAPSAGNFGTTWQMPQSRTSYQQTGFFITSFYPPYYFTLKNMAAPFICH